MSDTLLTAEYVVPITAPVIRDGAVLIRDGRIAAVTSAAFALHRHPEAERIDLGDSAIFPGLVNAHTHLELSGLTPDGAPNAFTDWITSLPVRLGRGRLPAQEIFPPAAIAGARESLECGVTTVGDISQHMDLTRPVLRDGPLRVVSYGEVLGLGGLQPRAEELLPRAVSPEYGSDRLIVGVTPHAPYTVDAAMYRRCLEIATARQLPLATHLAETPDETAFLADHAGPFRELWDRIGHWRNDAVERFAGGPVRYAKAMGLLDEPSLLAHVNYADDDELAVLASGRASVVYCPRTHAYFGHPEHPFRRMLATGVNVALGTDSRASAPDLNLLEEARYVLRRHGEVAPRLLWEMMTIRAARALRMDDAVGSLEAGKHADLAVFADVSSDPLRSVLESGQKPAEVWVAGVRILPGPAVSSVQR